MSCLYLNPPKEAKINTNWGQMGENTTMYVCMSEYSALCNKTA